MSDTTLTSIDSSLCKLDLQDLLSIASTLTSVRYPYDHVKSIFVLESLLVHVGCVAIILQCDRPPSLWLRVLRCLFSRLEFIPAHIRKLAWLSCRNCGTVPGR